MKMTQTIEKYMEQVNKLAALSDRVKLVPLNKWAQVVEVIEGNAATWPDKKFLDQFESYVVLDDSSEGVKHKKADFMLFTRGNCRDCYFDYDFECSYNPLQIKDFIRENNNAWFKLVLFKLPKSFLTHTARILGGSKEIGLLDSNYSKLLKELFTIFAECDEAGEIPLNTPVLSIPVEDIALCKRIYGAATLETIERFYRGYNSQELKIIQKALAMKSSSERGAKLVNLLKGHTLEPILLEELNKELAVTQDAILANLIKKGNVEIVMPTTIKWGGEPLKGKVETVPEELNLLFTLQSLFQTLGIQDGFERIADMSRIEAIKYIHSVIPEKPSEIVNILIEKCNFEHIKHWPTTELIKLFPLCRIPAKADSDTLAFYRYLNVLLLESVFAYSPALEKKFMALNFYFGAEAGMAGCVRLSVNSIPCLFEVFENPKSIIPTKLYIHTEDRQIKYMAALISAFCGVEFSFAEPEAIPPDKIFQLSYYALDSDRNMLLESLSNDIDKMEQCSMPGLMILPRSFTYDDFFAPLWEKIVKTRRIEQIIDYSNRLTIVISDTAQENVKIVHDGKNHTGNRTIPHTEIAEFSCLEPAHYPQVNICELDDFSHLTNFCQFASWQPHPHCSFVWVPIKSGIKGNQIGDRIDVIDNCNILLPDTLLIQPIDYSPKNSNKEPRFVAAVAELAENQTVRLRCQQLLPDYLAGILEKYKAMIFWGTAPGKAGDVERIKRIKQICIPDLSLKEQLRELYSMNFGKISESDSVAIDEAIDLRFKFDEAARRFLSEKLSPETINLMVNIIDNLNGYEPFIMYNLKPSELDSLKCVLIDVERSFEMPPSMRTDFLNQIIITDYIYNNSSFINNPFISKISEFIDNEIAVICKDAGIPGLYNGPSWEGDDVERRCLLAELDAKVFKVLYEKEHQLAVEKVRADEREKVIADLSHHIKNLVMSVIDPLELLREDDHEHQAIIENALCGVNLIREIVNAMNLSFSGSNEDVIYDFNNPSHDSMQLQDILVEGLRNAVRNMFDGKYFSEFRHGYFQDRDTFIEAKQQWQNLDRSNIDALKALLEQYFFTLDLKLQNADIPVGNQKSTAIKLLIMLQEIMLNAVKYSSFVHRAEREITISLVGDGSHITLEVENTFNPKSAVKSSRLGHNIIKNFVALFGAKVDRDINNGRYKIKIAFDFNPAGAKPNICL